MPWLCVCARVCVRWCDPTASARCHRCKQLSKHAVGCGAHHTGRTWRRPRPLPGCPWAGARPWPAAGAPAGAAGCGEQAGKCRGDAVPCGWCVPCADSSWQAPGACHASTARAHLPQQDDKAVAEVRAHAPAVRVEAHELARLPASHALKPGGRRGLPGRKGLGSKRRNLLGQLIGGARAHARFGRVGAAAIGGAAGAGEQ